MKKMTTINDIAKIAGVSKSTVSRYLNNGSVSKKTQEKLEKIIKEQQFIPNTFAQSLKAKQSKIIGTIVPRLDSFSIVESLKGMDDVFFHTDHQLMILNTYQSFERQISALQTFKKQKVDGIIFFASEMTQKHMDMFEELDIPMIIMGQVVDGFHSISFSDFEAGQKIGHYIAEKKYSEIYYFGVSEKDIAVGVNRRKGIQSILDKNAIKLNFIEVSFHSDDAYEKAKQLFEHVIPTYIACATDNIAIGVLKAAREKNISVPTQLSISGFGGYKITDDIFPSITTVDIDYEDAGRTAATSLLNLINDQKVPSVIQISNHLVKKQSTK